MDFPVSSGKSHVLSDQWLCLWIHLMMIPEFFDVTGIELMPIFFCTAKKERRVISRRGAIPLSEAVDSAGSHIGLSCPSPCGSIPVRSQRIGADIRTTGIYSMPTIAGSWIPEIPAGMTGKNLTERPWEGAEGILSGPKPMHIGFWLYWLESS